MSKDNKKVGYKKPPKKHQFKKGKSGNPKGRPPGPSKVRYEEHLRESVFKIFDRKLNLKIDGESCRMTAREAMYNQIAMKGAQGDHKFAKLGHEIMTKLSKDETEFRCHFYAHLENLRQFLLKHDPEDFAGMPVTMRDYYEEFIMLNERWLQLHEEDS